MFQAEKIELPHDDWIASLLILVFVILTVLKFIYPEKLNRIGVLFISRRHLQQHFSKEKQPIYSTFQLGMYLVQMIVLGLIAVRLTAMIQENPENYSGIALQDLNPVVIFSGITLYFFLRFLIGRTLAWIFDVTQVHQKIIFYKVMYLNNLTIWMLPLIALCFFSPVYKNGISIVMLFCFVLLLIVRYVLIMNNNKKLIFSDLFYFILYLCTLEIAPLVIILKIIL